MMLAELRELLAAMPVNANREDYQRTVLEDNVLGKRSIDSRKRSLRYLRELNGLDLADDSFRALRTLWDRDDDAQPLIALSSALPRDPALRATAPAVLRAPAGTTVTAHDLSAAVIDSYPNSYSDAVAHKIGRNAASTWTQSGHLAGVLDGEHHALGVYAGRDPHGALFGQVVDDCVVQEIRRHLQQKGR
jgi:hypothetical protein